MCFLQWSGISKPPVTWDQKWFLGYVIFDAVLLQVPEEPGQPSKILQYQPTLNRQRVPTLEACSNSSKDNRPSPFLSNCKNSLEIGNPRLMNWSTGWVLNTPLPPGPKKHPTRRNTGFNEALLRETIYCNGYLMVNTPLIRPNFWGDIPPVDQP